MAEPMQQVPAKRFMVALTRLDPQIEIVVGATETLPHITCWVPVNDRDPGGPIMLKMEAVDCVIDRNQLRIQLREETKSAVVSIIHEDHVQLDDLTAEAREEVRLARQETAALREAVAEVHDEIRTGNALTAGALLDNQETRRIAAIPVEERTPSENEHTDTVGIQTRSKSHPD